MEDSRRFGIRLRELRIRAGLTQRELAGQAGIDFTYLSKIENGVMPPPSEKVIIQLAETLSIDKDELFTLAGKIPPDIAEILKNRETFKRLRAEQTRKGSKALTGKGEAAHQFGGSGKLPEPIGAKPNFFRVAVAVILIILIGTLLWFAAPTTDTAVAANNQGVVFNKNGEYLKAIESFNQALALDPNLALAYNNRGWSYLELGQYEQAIADCDKAIELDPNLALAYSNRGEAYIGLGKYEEAIGDFNMAIKLDPGLQK